MLSDNCSLVQNGVGERQSSNARDEMLEELIAPEDLPQQHTPKCLSWLLRERRIDIKVALMKAALFHPTVWLFENVDDVIAAHGSRTSRMPGFRMPPSRYRPSYAMRMGR